jgi:hypothetical protein
LPPPILSTTCFCCCCFGCPPAVVDHRAMKPSLLLLTTQRAHSMPRACHPCTLPAPLRRCRGLNATLRRKPVPHQLLLPHSDHCSRRRM